MSVPDVFTKPIILLVEGLSFLWHLITSVNRHLITDIWNRCQRNESQDDRLRENIWNRHLEQMTDIWNRHLEHLEQKWSFPYWKTTRCYSPSLLDVCSRCLLSDVCSRCPFQMFSSYLLKTSYHPIGWRTLISMTSETSLLDQTSDNRHLEQTSVNR